AGVPGAVNSKMTALWNTLPALRSHFMLHRQEWGIGAAVMTLCLATIAVAVTLESRPSASPIQLQALDRKGELHIQWNPDSDLVRFAKGAKLFITDGSDRIYVKLDSARLRRGNVSYARRSDRVELRLALSEADGKLVEEQATYISARPALPRTDFQLQTSLKPVAPPVAPAAISAANAQAARSTVPVLAASHRTRTKPAVQSGRNLPFTCSAGDMFHKTDAPAGWDTFSCRGKNVWGLMKNQASEGGSNTNAMPNATTLTAKPAIASTT
ncbi:MAG: Mov34/MPN/PAD family protein, partial [Bryobacterales bacterium]|nr:Mov34/MPN/PAD family protein [Bryobacterales bacterium]